MKNANVAKLKQQMQLTQMSHNSRSMKVAKGTSRVIFSKKNVVSTIQENKGNEIQ